jgi:hypothetical protein
MLSRRGFLIGTGGLLTMAFVSDARAFIRRKEAPLLAVPPRTAHTLYWDWPDGLDEPQLFLDGEPEVIAPEPPTWRAFLKSLDAKDYAGATLLTRTLSMFNACSGVNGSFPRAGNAPRPDPDAAIGPVHPRVRGEHCHI